MLKLDRKAFREAGSALALLAIYLFTLLAPLHQAAAAQRAFAELGFERISAWSICNPVSTPGEQSPAAIKCPVTGAGKSQLALPVSSFIGLAADRPVATVHQDTGYIPDHGAGGQRIWLPRGPPAAI